MHDLYSNENVHNVTEREREREREREKEVSLEFSVF